MVDQEMSDSEKKKEDWLNAKWRPMMGWMYMLVCTMDFVVFPVLWSIHQSINHGNITTQWIPLTLQGAGLFHMAMGAVIGVAAFGRTQEKLAGVSYPGMNTGYNAQPNGFNNPSNGYNAPPNGFNNIASNTTVHRASYAGRPGPAPQIDPPV